MKKFVKSKSNSQTVTGATTPGTIYYKTNLKQVLDVLKDKLNIFCWKSLEDYGFGCIDFDVDLFGSYVDGDDLYICKTDGEDITVNGELVDPEAAMDNFYIDDLTPYIRPATPDVIETYITPYEVSIPDINQAAKDLLDDNYSFSDLVDAYNELNISQD